MPEQIKQAVIEHVKKIRPDAYSEGIFTEAISILLRMVPLRTSSSKDIAMMNWLQKGNTTNRQHFTAAALALPLTQIWRTTLSDAILGQPIAVEDAVYVCSLAALYRLDIQTGTILWEYPYAAPPPPRINAIKVSPAVCGERIFFTDMVGTLYCLDRTQGDLRWQHDYLGAHNEPLCVDNQHLFTKAHLRGETTVYGYACFNLEGDLVWFQPNAGTPSTNAAIEQGKLIFGDRNGFVSALDTISGAVIWSIKLQDHLTIERPRRGVGASADTHATGLPMIINDTIILTVNNPRNLCGLDLVTGAMKWHLLADADLPLRGSAQCLASDGQSLYYVVRNFFRRVDAAHGQITLTTDNQRHALGESLARAGLVAGRYYLAGFDMSQKVVAFDRTTGKIVWEFHADDDAGGFGDAGIYAHEKFMIGRNSGHIYCFAARS
jgi:outer membrane protein assembly factor BamB